MQLAIDMPIDRRSQDRQGFWRGVLASSLLHAAVLIALLDWPQAAPEVVLIPPIPVKLIEQSSAEGAAGNGNAGSVASTPPTSPAAPAAAVPATRPRPTPTAPPVVAPKRIAAAPRPTHKPPKHAAAALPEPAPPAPTELAAAPPSAETAAPTPPTPAEAATTAPSPPAPAETAPALPRAPAASGSNLAALSPSAGGPGQGAEGTGPAAVGHGTGPGDDYLERVRRRMLQFMTYPEEARRLKEQGTALLDITLARDGTVLDASIAKSSGFPLLDQAALTIAREASPVPPFPKQYTQAEGTFTMPFEYKLGFFDRVFR